jgi:hypothetical protein
MGRSLDACSIPKAMKANKSTIDVRHDQLEKRAKAISAMGLVNRDRGRFMVTTPSVRGRKRVFEVRRNEQGQVICECDDFATAGPGSGFRCEHILAVKYAIEAQNTERSVRAAEIGHESNVSKVNDQTESRTSERGEQEQEIAKGEEISVGPELSVTAEALSLGNTKGDKAMTNNDLKKVETDISTVEADGQGNNVLDFSSTLRELRRNVDPKLVKQREGWRDRNGNVQMVDYVEWHTVADILDDLAPNWAHTVKDIRQVGDIMTVTVAITIDGVTREGIGTGHANNEMGIKKAEHDALKRAAVKFGIARDLYRKESDVIEREGSSSYATNDEGFPTEPVARNLNELVTAKQLGMIRALAREIGVDPGEECQTVMNCQTDELSKKAASALITHLQDMQRQNDSPAQAPFRRAS